MVDLSVEALLEYDQIVKTTFSSENEGFEFYKSYAHKKCFGVRRGNSKKDKGNNQVCLRTIVSCQQGFRELRHRHMKKKNKKRKPRNFTRCGCLAKMVISLNKKTGQWYVKDFIDEHNHTLGTSDTTCFLRSHRGLTDAQKTDVFEMEIAGIRKHHIMDILEMQSGGFDKVRCTAKDIYKYCYMYKQETIVDGDVETVLSHLKARHERDADFFFKYLADEQGHLNDLFWSDAQSRLDYEAFGDVLVEYHKE